MRVTRSSGLLLVLGLCAFAAALTACPAFPGDICADVPGACGAGEGGPDGNGGDVKTDGPNIDAPPGCDLSKDPKDSLPCVADSVGVFVDSNGNDNNTGAKGNPVKTLTKAFEKAKSGGKQRVYVCEGTYVESAELKDALGIYGGFKCSDWSYTGTKPKFTGSKSEWALHIDSVGGAVVVEDMEFDGADVPMQAKGGSSIAAFVNASMSVAFIRTTLAGGTPQAGADGTKSDFTYPDINTTLKGNNASGMTGGAANTYTMCPGGGTTTGGKGGDNGLDGDTGLPGPNNKGTVAACSGSNTGGGNGQGAAAKPAAAGAAKVGSLVVTGWTAEGGQTGSSGDPGQGGGGGGGLGLGGGGGGVRRVEPAAFARGALRARLRRAFPGRSACVSSARTKR